MGGVTDQGQPSLLAEPQAGALLKVNSVREVLTAHGKYQLASNFPFFDFNVRESLPDRP